MGRWGAEFDPDRLADLETAMWKAYYRRQPARLFGLLVQGIREQAHVSWPRALAASLFLTRAAGRVRPVDRRLRPVRAGHRPRLPAPRAAADDVDAEEVARRELRWWVVRREIGLAAGQAAGDAITRLYAALYEVPDARVEEAGRLRGEAAEVRDRGATDDPDGPTRAGARPTGREVARLLRESYRSLHAALRAAS